MPTAIPTCLLVAALLAPAPSPRPGAAAQPPPTAPPAAADTAPRDDPPAAEGAPDPNGSEPAPSTDKVTRYSFTGLDIDGELRTPALLQFLARIAGEFETLGIPHRSFMPELRATVGDDAL